MNPSVEDFFVLDDIYFLSFYWTIFLSTCYLQILTRSFFVLLGDVTLSWLRARMFWDDGLSKTEWKIDWSMYRFYDAWPFCIDHN